MLLISFFKNTRYRRWTFLWFFSNPRASPREGPSRVCSFPRQSIKAHACVTQFQNFLSWNECMSDCLQYDARIVLGTKSCKLNCKDLASFFIIRTKYDGRLWFPIEKFAQVCKH